MPEKIIRDPVHDVIAFQLQRPMDAMLFRLINAAEFQRLRRIRQLGLASLVYPGADHSRYSHCLGVMETARQMLGHLGQSIRIEEADATACLAAALLHDLGHGPLSHVFEHVSNVPHEKLTLMIIQDSGSEVHRALHEHDRVCRKWSRASCNPRQRGISTTTSSQANWMPTALIICFATIS